MKKLLITGFEPFGGEKINPSWEAVKRLPDTIGGAQVIKRELPTAFAGARRRLREELSAHMPDAVISVGQAGGRACVTVERAALNLAEARIPDNEGDMPTDQPIEKDGQTAYFSTLPVRRMVRAVREKGLDCELSYSAGTFVCNCVMYEALYLAEKRYPALRAGFIHVPYLPEQTAGKGGGIPFLSLEGIVLALLGAAEAAVSDEGDAPGDCAGGTLCQPEVLTEM